MTSRQWLTFILCWCSGLAAGAIATLVPTYLPSIISTLTHGSQLPDASGVGAVLQSLFLVGWVTGGVVLGIFSDLRGRLPVLAASLGIAILGAVALPYADSPAIAYVLRYMTGIGVGSTMVISTTLGAEVLSQGRRAVFMGILANSYAFGIVGLGIMQTQIASWTSVSYIMMAFAVLIPVSALLRSGLQKAPSHVDSLNDADSLTAVLGRSRRDIVVGSLLFGCMLITLWASFSWLPTWATALFPGTDQGASLRGSIMISLGLGGITGSFFSGFIARRIGRVRTITLCYMGALIGCIALYAWGPSTPLAMMILVSFLAVFFGMAQGMMSLYIPELFPRRIRATSVGVCFNAGRLLTAGAVLNVSVLALSLGGYKEALLVFSAPLALGLIITRFANEPQPEFQSTTQ